MLFYKPREIMAIMAGRMINNGDIIFCGTGLSLITATVAKKIYAPDSIIFFETGGIDAALPELPISVADLRIMYHTSVNAGLIESFSILSHPKIQSKAFLGAAQIDKFGNLNSTSVGDYWHPTMRFSGSGGGGDAACLASEIIIFMPHEKRRFVQQLDYLTSPGWITGPGARELNGLYRGGPSAVITNLGIMKFDDKTKAVGFRLTKARVPEGVLHVCGYMIDFQFFKKQKFAYSAQTQVYAPPQNGVTHSKWERTGELSGHLERFPDLPDRDVWGQLTYFLAVRSGGNPPDNRSFSPLLQRAGGWGEIKYFNLSIKHPHLYHLYDSSSVISSGMNPTPLRPAASSLFLSVSLTIRSIPSLRMNNSLSLGINERFMITL